MTDKIKKLYRVLKLKQLDPPYWTTEILGHVLAYDDALPIDPFQPGIYLIAHADVLPPNPEELDIPKVFRPATYAWMGFDFNWLEVLTAKWSKEAGRVVPTVQYYVCHCDTWKQYMAFTKRDEN